MILELKSYIYDDEVVRGLIGDNLLNEYFVKFKDICQPLLVRLFNCILDFFAFPRAWSWEIIVALI